MTISYCTDLNQLCTVGFTLQRSNEFLLNLVIGVNGLFIDGLVAFRSAIRFALLH